MPSANKRYALTLRNKRVVPIARWDADQEHFYWYDDERYAKDKKRYEATCRLYDQDGLPNDAEDAAFMHMGCPKRPKRYETADLGDVIKYEETI